MGAKDTPHSPPDVRETRSRVDYLRPSFVLEKDVVEERAQWWDPRMKDEWDAADASPLESVDAASAARAAGQRN